LRGRHSIGISLQSEQTVLLTSEMLRTPNVKRKRIHMWILLLRKQLPILFTSHDICLALHRTCGLHTPFLTPSTALFVSCRSTCFYFCPYTYSYHQPHLSLHISSLTIKDNSAHFKRISSLGHAPFWSHTPPSTPPSIPPLTHTPHQPSLSLKLTLLCPLTFFQHILFHFKV
jgi:hypothetical protein